jgi:hypothetical protein
MHTYAHTHTRGYKGIGVRHTAVAFVASCDSFTYVDELLDPVSEAAKVAAKVAAKREQREDERVRKLADEKVKAELGVKRRRVLEFEEEKVRREYLRWADEEALAALPLHKRVWCKLKGLFGGESTTVATVMPVWVLQNTITKNNGSGATHVSGDAVVASIVLKGAPVVQDSAVVTATEVASEAMGVESVGGQASHEKPRVVTSSPVEDKDSDLSAYLRISKAFDSPGIKEKGYRGSVTLSILGDHLKAQGEHFVPTGGKMKSRA